MSFQVNDQVQLPGGEFVTVLRVYDDKAEIVGIGWPYPCETDLANLRPLSTEARRILHLESVIRKVVTAKQDDLCWRDVYTELAKELPENPAVDHTPPTPIFLANCARFEASLREGSPYVMSTCPKADKTCPGILYLDTQAERRRLAERIKAAAATLSESPNQ